MNIAPEREEAGASCCSTVRAAMGSRCLGGNIRIRQAQGDTYLQKKLYTPQKAEFQVCLLCGKCIKPD